MRPELAGALSVVLLIVIALAAVSYSDRVHAVTGLLGSFSPVFCLTLVVVAAGLALAGAPLRGGVAILAAIICAVPLIGTIAAARAPALPPQARSFLSIESFNVLAENTQGASAVARYVAGSGSDVFIVLEAHALFPYLAQIAEQFPYRVGCDTAENCDLLVVSRLPISDSRIFTATKASPNRIVRLSLEKDGTAFTLMAAHLTKPYFDDHGYDELQFLKRRVLEVQGPMILAGDFNQASWSPMLAKMLDATGLQTAIPEPATWPAQLGDWGIPIDHIFAKGGLAVSSLRAITDPMGSNHRGLTADIALAP